MNPKTLACTLTLLGFAAPVSAETRTFTEAECTYTLPGKDWEWLDPQLRQLDWGKTLVFARNQRGLQFTLRFRDLTVLDAPKSRSYTNFEADLLKDGRFTRLSGRHFLFDGVPSYQFDVYSTDGVPFRRIRVIYANDRFYHLQVSSSSTLEGDSDAELALLKFGFAGKPRPMFEPHVPDKEVQENANCGRVPGVLGTIGIAIMLILMGFGVWYVFRLRDG